MEEKWLYSEDDSFYDCEEFSSKEDAIECAREDEDIEESFFVGKKVEPKIAPLRIDMDKILEKVAEDTTYGLDVSMDIDYMSFLQNVTKEDVNELKKRMDDVLVKWIHEKGYSPNWYEIENIEIIKKEE